MAAKQQSSDDGKTPRDASDRPVAAVERALSILGAFRKGDRPLPLRELVERTGLYGSTILRLAGTLERFGYLDRTAEGAYQLGPMALMIGSLYQSSIQLADIVMPIMRELAEETGENVSYFVRRGDIRICLYRIESVHMMRDHITIGDTFPLSLGGSGRVFLAFDEPHDPLYVDIRKKLIAFSSGELVAGVSGMCAPILDAEGHAAGVLAISAPESRFRKDAIRRAESKIVEAAFRIAQRRYGDVYGVYQHVLGKAPGGRRRAAKG